MSPRAHSTIRTAAFAAGAVVLACAFAAVVRHQGQAPRTPLGMAVLLAIELAAIGLAVGYHLTELAGAPRRAPSAKPVRVEVDYL
jgi:hypothetical protein